jgi:hypothetical protein
MVPDTHAMLAPAKTRRKVWSWSLRLAETIARMIPQAMAKPMLYTQ